MTLIETIGRNIRLLRADKNLSQAELAKKCRVSQSTIAHIETGRKAPSFETLEHISKAVKLPAWRLLQPMGIGQKEEQ